MKVIKYNCARDIDVIFEDGTIVKNTTWGIFKRGSIRKPENRVGMEVISSENDIMKVIKYNNSSDVEIEFQDKWKYKKKTTWQKVINGNIKNPYHPNKYGGIAGTCKELGLNQCNITSLKEYNHWFNILIRCCNTKFISQHHTYKECVICEEWKYFWNFYKWVIKQENYVNWKKCDKGAIDKDILIKGNKIYSPETCLLVPKNINNILLKGEKGRGKYPIGVTKRKDEISYEAQCSNQIINKQVTIGEYNTIAQAFNAYKIYKENIISIVAEKEYESKNISKECYEALLRYIVEITD